MKKLDFQVPFTGFSHLGFHSALAAVHTYSRDCKASADSPCAKRDTGVCDGCGNCPARAWEVCPGGLVFLL